LPLLPQQSKQVAWILDHAKALDDAADQIQAPQNDNKWTQKLGPVGPIAILLAKSKGLLLALFKLKFLLSFASFLFVYSALYGINFGLGFAVLILVHELGHFMTLSGVVFLLTCRYFYPAWAPMSDGEAWVSPRKRKRPSVWPDRWPGRLLPLAAH
jgi:hypothetical protein